MDLKKSKSICNQTMILINAMVHITLPFNYNITISKPEESYNVQLQQNYLTSSLIKLDNLTSNTNYLLLVSNHLTEYIWCNC